MDLKPLIVSQDHYIIPLLEPPVVRRRPLMETASQILRAGLFSMILFAGGFFTLNAASYSEIIQASLLTADETSQAALNQHVEPVEEQPKIQKLLVVERTAIAQKAQIPELNLAITPPDNRIIIPKIDKNIPLIDSDPQKLMNADWKSLEKTFQKDLENGVIHYPGTANPGEEGNVFITGHSSYYPWAPGSFKSVFARLKDVEMGDDIIVYYNQEKHHYVVREKKEVKNNDVSVLEQGKGKFLTLMTCSPVGTNIKRLVVIAEEI